MFLDHKQLLVWLACLSDAISELQYAGDLKLESSGTRCEKRTFHMPRSQLNNTTPQDHWHSEAFKYGISMLSCLSFWGSIDCSTQRRVSCMFDIPCLRFTWFLEIILVTMGYNSANILKLNFRSTAYGCDSPHTWESSNNANRKCRKCHVLSWKLRSNQS